MNYTLEDIYWYLSGYIVEDKIELLEERFEPSYRNIYIKEKRKTNRNGEYFWSSVITLGEINANSLKPLFPRDIITKPPRFPLVDDEMIASSASGWKEAETTKNEFEKLPMETSGKLFYMVKNDYLKMNSHGICLTQKGLDFMEYYISLNAL